VILLAREIEQLKVAKSRRIDGTARLYRTTQGRGIIVSKIRYS